MEAFKTIIWIINIFSSLAIIALVLIQHGKGADAGASFGGGSGSAQGVFGSAGNANFLTRMTGLAAMIFFASCLALGYVNSKSSQKGGIDFSDVQQSSKVLPSNDAVSDNLIASMPVAASQSQNSTSGISNEAVGAAAATGAAAVAAKSALNQKENAKDKANTEKTKSDKTKSDKTKSDKKTDKNKDTNNSKDKSKKSDNKK